MTVLREFAPAKINLTLEILGRRRDGLHELRSLVAFADVGDTLTLDPARAPGVTVSGPFARGLAGTNVLDRALALLAERAPDLKLGAVHLEKTLPVAAGIGGGSADAGALLRALRHANGAASDTVDWHEIARQLGADVPVCFEARPLWMTGTGHELSDIAGGVPMLHVVIVNPMAVVPPDKTAQVFSALSAVPLEAGASFAPASPVFADRDALVAFAQARGNHLAVAAETVVQETGEVLRALRALPSVEHVAVSGAGPTAFGIFPDAAAADAARHELAATQPAWWIVSAKLG